MIYVMSDLHGCFDKYIKMLRKIQLKSEDTLYVLGDAVDRGPDGIQILLDMYERDNVVFLRGNHDQTAMEVLGCMFDPSAGFNDDKLVPMIQLWVSDGGNTTLEQFMSVSSDDRILVTGHTPTGLIEKAYAGRIYIRNNHIAVDCGAVFRDGRLGCICLNTMEEFYV